MKQAKAGGQGADPNAGQGNAGQGNAQDDGEIHADYKVDEKDK